MRIGLLMCLIFATQGLLLAQEAVVYSSSSAPTLGHPLDPADVAVLTGKAALPGRLLHVGRSHPYVYWVYGIRGSVPHPYGLASVTTATQPPFGPVLFGRVGDRPFVVIGRNPPFSLRARLFFSLGTRGFVLLGR